MNVQRVFQIVFVLVMLARPALGASAFTYSGKILDSNNVPLSSSNVLFTVTIYDALGQCWLYTEQRQLDLSQASGIFSFDIGSSDSTLVASSASFNGGATGPQNLSDVFSNVKTFSGLGTANSCSGTYTPNPADLTLGRVLAIYFKVDGGPDQALPVLKINPVPAALTVGGYGSGELLKINSSLNQTTNTNTPLSQAQYDEFWRLIKNPLAAYLPTTGDVTVSGANNKVTTLLTKSLPAAAPTTSGQVLSYDGTSWVYQTLGSGSVTSVGVTAPVTNTGTATAPVIAIPKGTAIADGYLDKGDFAIFNAKLSSTLTDGKILVGNASNVASEVTMSGDATISNAGALTLASTITAGAGKGTAQKVPQITYDAKGRLTTVTEVTIDDTTKLPLAGGTLTGTLTTDNVTMAANKYFGLSANSTDGTVAGQVWYDGGVIKYFDGTVVKSLGVAGAGITNLNGLSGASQTFATGTAGTAPAFNSATTVHTLNIPMASTATVTAGLISKTDYDSFAAKQSTALASAKVWVGNGSGVAMPVSLSGDATIDNAGVVTVDKSTTGEAKILALDGSGVGTMYATRLKAPSADPDSVTLGAQSTTDSYTLRFPQAAPAAGQSLQSDAGGLLSWVSALTSINNSATLTDAKLWIGNSSNKAMEVSLSGDVASVSNAGAVVIDKTASGTSSKILALDGSGIANAYGVGVKGSTSGTVTIQAPATFTNYALTLPVDDGTANQVLKTDGAGVLSWTTPSTTDATKLPLAGGTMTGDIDMNGHAISNVYLASAAILVGNASNRMAPMAMGGDVTIANNGVTTIGADKITSAKILDGEIVNADINASAAIAATKIGGGAVDNTEYSYLDGVTSAIQTQFTGKVAKAGDSMTGDLTMANQKAVLFSEATGGGTNTAKIQAPAALAADYTLTLPVDDGTANQVLQTDGAGVLSWASVSGGDFKADGSVAMTGTLRAADGAFNTPSISFGSATGTGIYSATGNLGFSASGSLGMIMSSSSLILNGSYGPYMRLGAGAGNTAAAPSYAFGGDSNTGMFNATTDTLGFATGGVEAFRVDAAGFMGIGTTLPLTKLDVSGVTRSTGLDLNSTYGGSQLSVRAPAAFTSYTLTLPSSVGGANQTLMNNGSGVLTWDSPFTVTVPASSVILMKTCPATWTDNGATGGGPGTASCDGTSCRMCQSPGAADYIPASSTLLMESCPNNWTNLGAATGPGAAGYQNVNFVACQSPASATSLAVNSRVIMSACPSQWIDVGATGPSNAVATCSGSPCRVCEVPGLSMPSHLQSASGGTTQAGQGITLQAGAGGSTSGAGGPITIRAGASTDGDGGSITIASANGATTTATTRHGGAFTITAGDGVSNGNGGNVTINAGAGNGVGTVGNIYLNSTATGNVAIGSATANAKLDVNGAVKIGTSADGCAVSNAGSQRYNSTENIMEYCNGTMWVDFNPPGTNCGLQSATITKNCRGVDITTSCPDGYTRTLITLTDTLDGTHVNGYYTCVKN